MLVEALFVPPQQDFSVSCKFRYCVDIACLRYLPVRSNLSRCQKLSIDPNEFLSQEELNVIFSLGLPVN